MEFVLDHEEEVTTDPETEEVDEKFYMNRLLMLDTAGILSTSGHHSPPLLSSHCEISPEIGLLVHKGVRIPASSSQISASPCSLGQSNTVCKEDDGPAKINQTKVGPVTLETSSKSRRIHTNNKQPHPNPTTLVEHPEHPEHGTSQCVCSKQSTVGSQRSLIKCNGSLSKSRSQEPGCRDLSSERVETVNSAVVSHMSTRGQQTPGTGSCGSTVKKPTSDKRKVSKLRSIHKRNKFGETPLHLAVMKGDLQSVKDIIEVGARVNLADNAGWTPLHEAALGHNCAIAETLLKAGAKVNSVGYEGIMPLHDAVLLGNFKLVQLLLKWGANPLLKNQKGDNAIDLCQDMSMEKLLRQYASKHCRRTRQSPAVDAAELCQTVCPDSEDSAKVQDSSSAHSEERQSGQTLPQLRDQTKDSDIDASLAVQERESMGCDTMSCPDSDHDSDITVDYTETRSSSPEHWALSATQDFLGAINR
ncbi:ankyrin repeat domain-containing protein 31 isoform X1 [Silurus meridionalis]|uniref:ankyrin repeat domain-containing protein 31 isoform X1 n=1 Tax=Silurus meridionalis TaxID=175797 RepID=UPI001EECEAB4|nr:ankyrin repeat domain-containing protein 31 isoform X1 [Silurus meridionalis]